MTEETVRDYAEVARHFTAHDIEVHTRSRLALLVRIVEAQQGAELPRRVRIRPEATTVPVRVGRRIVDRPFVDLDARALRAVARALVKRGAGAPDRGEHPLIAALRSTLRAAGSDAGARLSEGRVTISDLAAKELQRVCAAVGRDAKVRSAVAALGD
ncbi:MAG: hypothetical protein IT379_35625 [Deltaproteobacteria bacterium]|nr:hypothetical protein [Deltaproteobacteria bacterium]